MFRFPFPVAALAIACAVLAFSPVANNATSERDSAGKFKTENLHVQVPPLPLAAAAQAPTLVPGPNVIVGDLPDMRQFGSAGTQVGLGMATTSCNNGDQPINWFALP